LPLKGDARRRRPRAPGLDPTPIGFHGDSRIRNWQNFPRDARAEACASHDANGSFVRIARSGPGRAGPKSPNDKIMSQV